jgi:hypothetical protein
VTTPLQVVMKSNKQQQLFATMRNLMRNKPRHPARRQASHEAVDKLAAEAAKDAEDGLEPLDIAALHQRHKFYRGRLEEREQAIMDARRSPTFTRSN